MPGTEKDAGIKNLVRSARITLLEALLIEAAVLYNITGAQEKARAQVKDHTKSMSLVRPPLTAVDIEPSLWRAAQQVLDGTATYS